MVCEGVLWAVPSERSRVSCTPSYLSCEHRQWRHGIASPLSSKSTISQFIFAWFNILVFDWQRWILR